MHASDDQKKKDIVEAKNIAEQLVYTSEKALKDAGDKVPADVKTSVEAKVAELKTAKDATTPNIDDIKRATEALSAEIQKIGQAMNSAASAAQTPPNPEGTVRDAETKEPGTDSAQPGTGETK